MYSLKCGELEKTQLGPCSLLRRAFIVREYIMLMFSILSVDS